MSRPQGDLFTAPEPPATDVPADVAPLIGLKVQMKGQRCVCGCPDTVIAAGKAMHKCALKCAACGSFRMWLGAAHFQFIAGIVANFGRPTEPVEIRPAPRPSASRADRGIGFIGRTFIRATPDTAQTDDCTPLAVDPD